MDLEKIKMHYRNKILTSSIYNSDERTNELSLLYPDFFNILIECFNKYHELKYNQTVYIVETYRSNKLQQKYFSERKTKIRKNSMHHYGLAVDVAFYINGKFTYKGDYDLLRKIFREAGLTVLEWELGHVQYVKINEQDEVRKICED